MNMFDRSFSTRNHDIYIYLYFDFKIKR